MEIKILSIVWGEIEEAAFTQLPTTNVLHKWFRVLQLYYQINLSET